MPTTLTLTQAIFIGGVRQNAGTTITVDDAFAGALISENKATRPVDYGIDTKQDAQVVTNPSTNEVIGIINPKTGVIESLNKIYEQFAVPIILPPGNGSTTGLQLSGTTGGFTITTSTFPAAGSQGFAYPQGCYMVIPAGNGIGLTAGTYYAVLTAANAGTLYANTLTAGQVPALITSPTPLSGLTSGAWLTQVTTVQELVTIPLTGGALGSNGSCEMYIQNAVFVSANQKTTTCTIGGTTFYTADFGGSAGTSNGQMLAPRLFNRGNQNNQVSSGSFNSGLSTAQGSSLSTSRPQVDLSATQNIVIRAQLAANTDWYSLESVMIRINPKP